MPSAPVAPPAPAVGPGTLRPYTTLAGLGPMFRVHSSSLPFFSPPLEVLARLPLAGGGMSGAPLGAPNSVYTFGTL